MPIVPATRIGDSLDRWADDRDVHEEDSLSAAYVPREVVGYQDLDAFGDWYQDPVYGVMWMPVVSRSGWAPYQNGRWSWISPWGWTWVAAEPWGFATCHYGRWVQARHGWAWAPGAHGAPRPVYSPALVAWRGERYPRGNPDTTHGRHVGWIPLGFNEVYNPPFGASPGYVRATNLSNTHLGRVDIERYIDERRRSGARGPDRRYINENVSGAYSTAPNEAFASANPVGRLVLYLCKSNNPENGCYSDCICTGLQLANFWQDVARDLDIGRVYLPEEDLRRFGFSEADLQARRFTPQFAELLRFEVDRTRALFQREDIAEASANIWSIEIQPGQILGYAIDRQGRHLRILFDLARPIQPPRRALITPSRMPMLTQISMTPTTIESVTPSRGRVSAVTRCLVR